MLFFSFSLTRADLCTAVSQCWTVSLTMRTPSLNFSWAGSFWQCCLIHWTKIGSMDRVPQLSPDCSATAHCADSQSTLLKGILSWHMECTPWLQCPLPLITPYKRQVQVVGAQRINSQYSRAHSVMKTRFWAIFLQVLEVITAYASSASVPVTSWPRRMSLRNMQEWLRGWLVWRQSGVLSVRANSLLSWRRYTRTRLLLTGKLKILSIGSSYVFFSALLTCFVCWRVTSIHIFFVSS